MSPPNAPRDSGTPEALLRACEPLCARVKRELKDEGWSADEAHLTSLRLISVALLVRLLQSRPEPAALILPAGGSVGAESLAEDVEAIIRASAPGGPVAIPEGVASFASSGRLCDIPAARRREYANRAAALMDGFTFCLTEPRALDRSDRITPEVIGDLHERLSAAGDEGRERTASGIFYTPRTEIDLMVRLSIVRYLCAHLPGVELDWIYNFVFGAGGSYASETIPSDTTRRRVSVLLDDIRILDPACGSGAFIMGALQVLDDLSESVRASLGIREPPFKRRCRIASRNLFGVDVKSWALEVTRFRLELALLDAATADELSETVREFRPASNAVGRRFQLGDAIASDGADSAAGARAFVWEETFPEVFSAPNRGFDLVIGNPPYVRQENISDPFGGRANKREYKRRLEEAVIHAFPDFFGRGEAPAKKAGYVDRKSDLYVYFFYLGLRLLNESGTLCLVTSNSWLDVGYGRSLQQFLLKKSRIRWIIGNEIQRSFSSADVNTVVTLATAAGGKDAAPESPPVRFVQLKVPFSRVLNGRFWADAEQSAEREEDDIHRIHPVDPRLLRTGPANGRPEGAAVNVHREKSIAEGKWGGPYLRAPDVYWRVIEKGAGRLVPLREVAEVRRGYTTGANDFFYLTEAEAAEARIEPEFLRPLLKSPRDVRSLIVPENPRHRIFLCDWDREELAGTQALRYIERGESMGVHRRPSCAARPRWYSLSAHRPPLIVAPCGVNERFRVFANPAGVHVDKRLYEVHPTTPHAVALAASLNCTLTSFFLEIMTRTGLGEGLLDMTVYELQDCLIVDPALVSGSMVGTGPERHLRDPREIDDLVLTALGLTSAEKRALAEALLHLIRSRLDKATSV